MFGTEKLPLEIGDRVAAVKDGKIMKGRVVEQVADVAIFVTFEKGGEAVAYGRDEIMLLYRQVPTPKGKGVIPFIMGAPTRVL